MVINSIDINKTKESLNRDGDQFHRYQQNEHSSFTIAELTEHNNKQTTTYHVETQVLNWERHKYVVGLNR